MLVLGAQLQAWQGAGATSVPRADLGGEGALGQQVRLCRDGTWTRSPSWCSTCPTDFMASLNGGCLTFCSCNTLLWCDFSNQLYSIVPPRGLTSKGIPASCRMSLFWVVSTLRFCFKGTQPTNELQL